MGAGPASDSRRVGGSPFLEQERGDLGPAGDQGQDERRDRRIEAEDRGQASFANETIGEVTAVAAGRDLERGPIGKLGRDIRAFVDGLERRLGVAREDGPGQGAGRTGEVVERSDDL